jgi:poly-gamma-glutamate synthesis protein (capsule biosynthesis protein)
VFAAATLSGCVASRGADGLVGTVTSTRSTGENATGSVVTPPFSSMTLSAAASPPDTASPSGAAGASSSAGAATDATRASATPVGTATTASQTRKDEPSGEFTLALAGDINFSGRTATLLAENPATALREAAAQLSPADLTMVNLESAITTRGTPAPKQFHFRAPATALDALAAGGVDLVTMANNHAVDYGDQGLADTLAAVKDAPIPVLGIGANAAQAYAPWAGTVNGVRVAVLAASQVHDWTTATHTATATKPGIASAFSPQLIAAVKAAKARADVVIVYLHWGIEYQTCPSGEQRALADALAKAGATAVVGTHVHVLQGAGWRSDGSYVAYGLGNYFWWKSFGNQQDDNGVLTLTFDTKSVISARFLPTHLDDRGVPQVATGAQRDRIDAEWARDRQCAGLAATPP